MWSDNFTAAFFVGSSAAVFIPDIDGIQNKLICLWTGTTCLVNTASTCSANSYGISHRKPSRMAPNFKQPRAPKMKIRLCMRTYKQRHLEFQIVSLSQQNVMSETIFLLVLNQSGALRLRCAYFEIARASQAYIHHHYQAFGIRKNCSNPIAARASDSARGWKQCVQWSINSYIDFSSEVTVTLRAKFSRFRTGELKSNDNLWIFLCSASFYFMHRMSVSGFHTRWEAVS